MTSIDQEIRWAFSDSKNRDKVVDLYDVELDDILRVAEELGYETDYCDIGEFVDIWGWYEGVTDEGCQEWRVNLYNT